MIVKLYVRVNRSGPEISIASPTIRFERMQYIDRNVRGRLTAVFVQIFLWSFGVKVYTFPGRKPKPPADPYRGHRKK